jgi:hypothetical protein
LDSRHRRDAQQRIAVVACLRSLLAFGAPSGIGAKAEAAPHPAACRLSTAENSIEIAGRH